MRRPWQEDDPASPGTVPELPPMASRARPDASYSVAFMAEADDRREIRELLENWVVWRDAGMWERFRTVWHDDGRMMATWFQGSADEFIEANRQGWARGVRILHFLGGSSIDLAGDRAVAQTKTTISQRAEVHGVLCDVVCTGRFHDFLERRDGRWRLVLRQPIYEKDRLDPVDPAARLELDPELLARFPEGYRHLAYLQTQVGYAVKDDMPGLDGPAVEALYARGARWLAGGDCSE
jgi:SnoaL-like domain